MQQKRIRLSKAAVFVEHITRPSTFLFASSIRNKLKLVGVDEALVVAKSREDSNIQVVSDFKPAVTTALRTNASIYDSRPELSHVSTIFPSYVQFEGENIEDSLQYGLIFVTIRNRRGCEWIFMHPIHELPEVALQPLTIVITECLGERPAPNPTVEEYAEAKLLINAVRAGIVEALQFEQASPGFSQ